ncbi:MAG TPA: hypothetical protein VK866_02740 [Acidimicrobiales bacterium]|nr:hypothetical protein [Acidimicrobiales bacterium]
MPSDPTTVIDPWVDVVGQPEAVAHLRAAAVAPVHAYLFVGPEGSGRRAAARAFAAELFAAGADPAAAERHVRLALAEQHADLTVVERTGASIPVGDAREPEPGSARWVVRRASMAPVDAGRSVYVLLDFHLVSAAAPVLLKTIEEPPPHVVFVVVADEVTPELVTIASRCVRVDFHRVPVAAIEERLCAEGVAPDVAGAAAAASLGDLDRARLLATDPRLGVRLAAWASVPERLDGSGSTIAALAGELAAHVDDAQAPLDERQRAEAAALDAQASATGGRIVRKDLEATHKRATRRLRTDELRHGFSVLAARYRDALGTGSGIDTAGVLASIDAIREASEALVRNPNEALLLQALLCRVVPLGGSTAPR